MMTKLLPSLVVGTATALCIATPAHAETTPTAVADSYRTTVNTALEVPAPGVLANDTDIPDGFGAQIVTWPANTFSSQLDPSGSFTLLPEEGFVGTTTFSYCIGTLSPETFEPICASDVAIVTVEVVDGPSGLPQPRNDEYTVGKNTILEVPAPGLAANDTDVPAGLVLGLVGSVGSHGWIEVRPDASLWYRPNGGFVGDETLQYCYLSDRGFCATDRATVTIHVVETGVTPVANPDSFRIRPAGTLALPFATLLANDTGLTNGVTATVVTEPSHGGLAYDFANQTLRYVPARGFVGTDSFTYCVGNDNGAVPNCASNTTTVTVEVGSKPSVRPTPALATTTAAAPSAEAAPAAAGTTAAPVATTSSAAPRPAAARPNAVKATSSSAASSLASQPEATLVAMDRPTSDTGSRGAVLFAGAVLLALALGGGLAVRRRIGA